MQKQKFKWAEGVVAKGINAQRAGERIARIAAKNDIEALDENDDRLKAAILADAKNPNSPLHKWFTWNKDEAFETYLWTRAGELLRGVKTWIHFEGGGTREVRAFVSTIRNGHRDFMPIVEVLNNEQLRVMLVQDALKALDAWKEKYAHLLELSELFVMIELGKPSAKPAQSVGLEVAAQAV